MTFQELLDLCQNAVEPLGDKLLLEKWELSKAIEEQLNKVVLPCLPEGYHVFDSKIRIDLPDFGEIELIECKSDGSQITAGRFIGKTRGYLKSIPLDTDLINLFDEYNYKLAQYSREVLQEELDELLNEADSKKTEIIKMTAVIKRRE